jgi:hypothetical protein
VILVGRAHLTCMRSLLIKYVSEESGYGIANDFKNIDPALLDIIAQLQVASVRGS